ncbi:hypothetical protein Hanom_Chr16g01479461 [Helianthus anomalus]
MLKSHSCYGDDDGDLEGRKLGLYYCTRQKIEEHTVTLIHCCCCVCLQTSLSYMIYHHHHNPF